MDEIPKGLIEGRFINFGGPGLNPVLLSGILLAMYVGI
jgi:hypothetical protein